MFKRERSLTLAILSVLCSSDVTMEQWLLGDLCSPHNTEPKLHYSYSSKPPVAMFSLTSLCCGSCDPGRDDDVIVLDDDDNIRVHKEGQGFMELVVMVTKYNTITCLKRYPINV